MWRLPCLTACAVPSQRPPIKCPPSVKQNSCQHLAAPVTQCSSCVQGQRRQGLLASSFAALPSAGSGGSCSGGPASAAGASAAAAGAAAAPGTAGAAAASAESDETGLQECGCASQEEALLLRLLTPLAKLFTAKEAVAVASEGIEFFGGQGYIESTHLPVILRDAQVLPLWEGSTNVLVLDVLRVLGGAPRAAAAFVHSCAARLEAAAAAAGSMIGSAAPAKADLGDHAGSVLYKTCVAQRAGGCAAAVLRRACLALGGALPSLSAGLQATLAAGPASREAQVGARELAFAMARLFVGALLAEHAAWSGELEHALLADEWAREALGPSTGIGGSTSSGGWGGKELLGAQGQAEAQLLAARVLSGADRELSQPRARY